MSKQLLKKYIVYRDNVQWHIDTNKPDAEELLSCQVKIKHYDEIIKDLESISTIGEGWIELKEGCEMPDYDELVLWHDVGGHQFPDMLDKDGNDWLEHATHWKRLGKPPVIDVNNPEIKRKQKLYEEWMNKTLDGPEGWINVENKPLVTVSNGGWIVNEGVPDEFLAAVLEHNNQTGKDNWWIRHCAIIDERGLCVVTDDDHEPAGWEISDVLFYWPFPLPPAKK